MEPSTISPPEAPSPVLSPAPETYEPPKKSGWRSVLSTVLLLISAPLVAVLLTSFVFQSYEVDGPSMQETLQNHDRLIVLKLPRTISRLNGHAYIPHRGDIIVFVKHNLSDAGLAGDKQLIKRVIGLPGDRVVVYQGTVTVYNQQNPDGFKPDVGTAYSKYLETTSGNVDLTVGSGELFVCGDNRPNSLDSRSFGAIPASDVVGKLVLRVLPLNKAESF